MATIKITVFSERETEEEITDVVKQLVDLGKTCKRLKKAYPATRGSIVSQFGLEYGDEKISDKLFERKLEIMLEQDNERRSQK